MNEQLPKAQRLSVELDSLRDSVAMSERAELLRQLHSWNQPPWP